MSTPSRKTELRHWRSRHSKIDLLRRHYKMAKSDTQKSTLLEKLDHLNPPLSRDEFLRAIESH